MRYEFSRNILPRKVTYLSQNAYGNIYIYIVIYTGMREREREMTSVRDTKHDLLDAFLLSSARLVYVTSIWEIMCLREQHP